MGCGRVGSELAARLESGEHTVAVIDKNPTAFRMLRYQFKGKKIEGYGFDEDILREAGIERAEAFAAVSSGDNSNIVADLLAAGHQVTMIEKDLHVLEVARPSLKEAEWFPFDACEVLSLVMAGIAHADVMVAATGDDEDNLVISLLAKQEFAVPRVVARVNNPKNHGLFTKAWGVDVAVSTTHILRSLVEEAVTVGSMITVMQFERGHVSLHSVNLADRSVAVGRTLRDLALPMDAAAVAVVREGHVVVPKEDTVFAAGDEVLVVASEGSESQVRDLLVGEEEPDEPAEPAEPE